MSSRVALEPSFIEWCCPSWFGPVPNHAEHDPKVHGDWKTVTVLKRDHTGEYVKTFFGNPMKFRHTMEVSTGDLYSVPMRHSPPDERYIVVLKALVMFCFTSIYTLGVMGANLIKIVADITSVFWRVIPQLISDLFKKGGIAALGNAVMATFVEIPVEVIQDIWRICQSPFFAVAMKLACLYTLVSPFEGRKWLGKIENGWHQGTSYKMDIRRGHGEDINLTKFFLDIFKGKIWFLGYCMQKRGNIGDKVAGKDKFEIVSS